MGVSKAEADAMVEAPKSIGEPIRWQLVPNSQGRYKFAVRVLSSQIPQVLYLHGRLSLNSWSYVLIGPGTSKLRRISKPKHPHRVSDGTEVDAKHKHYWTEETEEIEVYIPEGIRWDNRNDALRDFLEECNISMLHPYEDFLLQKKLR